MDLFPFKILHHWKRLNFDAATEIMTHIVVTGEQDIKAQQTHYRNEPPRTEYWDVGDELLLRVEFYGPFNSEAWDLDELVDIYLPTLQRGALLLAVCAAVEDEFFSLCNVLARREPERPQINDLPKDSPKSLLKARGISRTLHYMESVVKIQGMTSCAEWRAVEPILKVRNLFAHQNGRAPDVKQMKALGPHVSSATIGRGLAKDMLVLDEQYLSRALDAFSALAHRVQQAVVKRYP